MTKTTWITRAVLVLGGVLAAGGAWAQGGERFVVSGVVLFDDGGLVWLQEPNLTGGRVVPLRVSESVGPYRLTKILNDRIELQGPTGTVLVPVYTAGVGNAVAAGSPDNSGGFVRSSVGSRLASGAEATPQVGPVPQPGAPAGATLAPGMEGLRDRLEAARRQVEQLRRNPPPAQAAETPISARQTPPGVSSTGSGQGQAAGAPQQGAGGEGAAAATAPAPGGNPNVVFPQRRQTFQSILGLH